MVFPEPIKGLQVYILALCGTNILFVWTYSWSLTQAVHYACTSSCTVIQYIGDLSSNCISFSLRSFYPVTRINTTTECLFSISHRWNNFKQFNSTKCTRYASTAGFSMFSLSYYWNGVHIQRIPWHILYPYRSNYFLIPTTHYVMSYSIVYIRKIRKPHGIIAPSITFLCFPWTKFLVFLFSALLANTTPLPIPAVILQVHFFWLYISLISVHTVPWRNSLSFRA